MPVSLDLLTEQLTDAPLSPEQRAVWNDLCGELVLARVRVQELENRLRVIESQSRDGPPASSVLNKPDFNREVARMLAFDERYGTESSVLYFDIENLDVIRQRHGNALAEAAVRTIGDTLLGSIRRSDILGRLAPDEFGILLPRCSNENAWKKGELVAAKVYDALIGLWGPNLKPVLSYGAYTFKNKEDIAAGLKNAAQSMTQLIRP